MAAVDFAFLAEYAKAEPNGTLTTVGAGFLGVILATDGAAFPVFVAGRVRQDPGTENTLGITIESPNREYSLEQSIALDPVPAGVNLATTVFAVQVQVPVAGPGRYGLTVNLGEAEPFPLEMWLSLPVSEDAATGESNDPRTGA